jgi:hypothetical protein
MPPAVKKPTPKVRLRTVGPPAIVVPTGWSAADPIPPMTSNAKTSQSSGATPIRLKKIAAKTTPSAPIVRNPTSSASEPNSGCVTDEATQ